MNDLVVRDKNELVEQLQQKLQSKEKRRKKLCRF